MQTLVEFKTEHSGGKAFKPDASMLERWHGRIVPQGLEHQGVQGANYYLQNYGKGIGVDKLVKLARTAEFFEAIDLAYGFWLAAYRMAYGQEPTDAALPLAGPVKQTEQTLPTRNVAMLDFPDDLQPGKIRTMQPTDARYERQYYIESPLYIGQPKRDGKRTVAFVTENLVVTQARSHTIGTLPVELAQPLSEAAQVFGPFIIDGELWFADWKGNEHRTGAQAATVNVEEGYGSTPVTAHYAFFDCIYGHGEDLRQRSALERIEIGGDLKTLIHYPQIEFLWPAFTTEDKRQLAESQKRHGREGEVWRYSLASYQGGKNRGEPEIITRTKYIVECTVMVTGFTPTRAEKDLTRRFAAIQVADPETGQPLGEVGTGFTRYDQDDLLKRFESGPYLITVASQGRTEGASGKLWLPRFVDFGDVTGDK